MAGGGQRRIDPGLGGLALNLVSALILIGIAWGAFKGSSEAQVQSLQKQLDRLEARVERMDSFRPSRDGGQNPASEIGSE